jgi:HSP20 family protein
MAFAALLRRRLNIMEVSLMASTDNPAQTQTEATQQGARARSQPEGNGGKAGQQLETRERSEDRRGAPALTASRGRRDLVGGASNPFELMWQLSREMDRMMSSVFGAGSAPLFGSRSLFQQGRDETWSTPMPWSPRIDVEQRGDSIMIRADLPGVRKEDVQIDVTDEGLTIAGERREEREEGGGEDQSYRAIERTYGAFYRTVPLPQKVNIEKLTAKMHDGVLQITVPLEESARPRRIPIQD